MLARPIGEAFTIFFKFQLYAVMGPLKATILCSALVGLSFAGVASAAIAESFSAQPSIGKVLSSASSPYLEFAEGSDKPSILLRDLQSSADPVEIPGALAESDSNKLNNTDNAVPTIFSPSLKEDEASILLRDPKGFAGPREVSVSTSPIDAEDHASLAGVLEKDAEHIEGSASASFLDKPAASHQVEAAVEFADLEANNEEPPQNPNDVETKSFHPGAYEVSRKEQKQGDKEKKRELRSKENLFLLDGDPLAPLLLLPAAPNQRGVKALIAGVLLLAISVWMALEADATITKGPANIIGNVGDFDVEDVATIGSTVMAIAAGISLLAGVNRHVVGMHEQRRWIQRAEHGIAMARRFHQNRMQRLLERHGLPDLWFSHVDASRQQPSKEEERRRWGHWPRRYATESSEDRR